MFQTLLPVLKEIWKAPAGKQVIALCLIIAFGTPLFLGYYYADVIKDNKALKLELKEERLNKQVFINDYIRKIEECEDQKITIQEEHIKRFNEFRDKVEADNLEKTKQLERDYREAIQTITKTKKVIEKTSKELNKKN